MAKMSALKAVYTAWIGMRRFFSGEEPRAGMLSHPVKKTRISSRETLFSAEKHKKRVTIRVIQYHTTGLMQKRCKSNWLVTFKRVAQDVIDKANLSPSLLQAYTAIIWDEQP